MTSGLLSFAGGLAEGFNTINREKREKQLRDQDRFSQLAMNSIMEFKREYASTLKQQEQINSLGTEAVRRGFAPEVVDYAASLPYEQAVKMLSDPEALRNIRVDRGPQQQAQPQQQAGGAPAPAAAPGVNAQTQAAMGAPGATPTPAPAPTAAPQGQPQTAPQGQGLQQPGVPSTGAQGMPVANVQTFGMRPGTTDPLAVRRQQILELAKNAGWDEQTMAQFQQAAQAGQNLGIYRFSNPETAARLIFTDPRAAERLGRAQDQAMNTMLVMAQRLDPSMPAGERIKILGEAFTSTFSNLNGGSTDGMLMPSPTMLSNLAFNPQFAMDKIRETREKAERDQRINDVTAGLMQRNPNMPQEQARTQARAIVAGLSQAEPRQPVDPNPGYNQISSLLGTSFRGDVISDPATGGIRVRIADPGIAAEFSFANQIAQDFYRTSLQTAGNRSEAITPASAAQFGMGVLERAKGEMRKALEARNNDPASAREAINGNLSKMTQEADTLKMQQQRTPEQERRLTGLNNSIMSLTGALLLIDNPGTRASVLSPASPVGRPSNPRANAPAPARREEQSAPAVTVPLPRAE